MFVTLSKIMLNFFELSLTRLLKHNNFFVKRRQRVETITNKLILIN